MLYYVPNEYGPNRGPTAASCVIHMLHNHFDISDVLLELRSCNSALDQAWSEVGTPTVIQRMDLHMSALPQPFWLLVWRYRDREHKGDLRYHWWFYLACDYDDLHVRRFSTRSGLVDERYLYTPVGNLDSTDEWLSHHHSFLDRYDARKIILQRDESDLDELGTWVKGLVA